MSIQWLESRRLLATTLANGILEVEATGGNDRISVYMSANGFQLIVQENILVQSFDPIAVLLIVVNAGGGNDVVRIANAITANATIHGGAGNDVLRGGAGRDRMLGEAGNDRLDGGKAGDFFSGGDGKDTADYSGRVSAVFVVPDRIANDGRFQEGDNVLPDVETLVGGSGPDDLVGSGRSNRLIGNGGNDSLAGGSGHDTIFGNDGNDVIQGNLGNDLADGGADSDTFRASQIIDGTDTFSGGEGRDSISYSRRTLGVNIGVPADTTPGAAVEDIVDATVEAYFGGDGPDRIIVSNNVPDASWLLSGQGGGDTIQSLAGDNVLVGDSSVGADHSASRDLLMNFTGASTLRGGRGNDTLITNDSTDAVLEGGTGDDLFRAIDSIRTEISGEEGSDTLDCSFISTGGAFVTLDDIADDRISTIEVVGMSQSNVHSDVESVIGSQGEDTILGN
jgi:Ca2+-binding RTX toxin-like protein